MLVTLQFSMCHRAMSTVVSDVQPLNSTDRLALSTTQPRATMADTRAVSLLKAPSRLSGLAADEVTIQVPSASMLSRLFMLANAYAMLRTLLTSKPWAPAVRSMSRLARPVPYRK